MYPDAEEEKKPPPSTANNMSRSAHLAMAMVGGMYLFCFVGCFAFLSLSDVCCKSPFC